MTQAFDDYAASRIQYAATMPQGDFAAALRDEALIVSCLRKGWFAAASDAQTLRDSNLLRLTIRALRNQGQPYYTQEVTPGDN